MAYKYDVFLSYNRKRLHGEWVHEVFLPLFVEYLGEALNKDIEIFIDKEEIEGGNDWRMKIENALIHSRIMVSVLSSAYFRSEWCKKEFAVMDYRQRKTGYLTLEKPEGLIIPVKIFDGEHFPDYANRLQMFDCNKFNITAPAFKQSVTYIDFQRELQHWVSQVAVAYNSAPDWNDDWKHADWIEKSWENLDILDCKKLKNVPTL